ncbi:ComEC/Rec2 family competence protein [Thioclava sp. A2]|uniref:ComEC/Rec2 family competence protein n=1 Tax=Thioclava sp. FCG-A2 TaxID=3080562 RepID=UPI002954C00E|nr:ComEC/Rec2 family competence protein [Thioclava sp. A2]MDV7269503.1 ComEC/Rec2 family competence protein [Thioclava sp. A2]
MSGALAAARADLVLWLPIGLGCGIGGYFALPVEPEIGALMALACVALLALWAWARGAVWGQLPAAVLAMMMLGVLLAALRAQSVAAPVLEGRYYGPVEGRVVAIDRSAKDAPRLTLDGVYLPTVATEVTPARVRVALYGDQPALPDPGQRVMLTAHLQPPNGPASPEGFDFRRLAWFQELGGLGYTRAPVLITAPAAENDRLLAGYRLRLRLSAAVQARLAGQEGAVAAALLTGDRSGISERTRQIMRDSNLFHVIAISGLHMGLVVGFVFGLVRYGLALVPPIALRWPVKKIAAVLALIAAGVYLWVAGAQVATQRAFIMAAVMLVAVMLDRRAISLRTVALAALLILLWRPESLVEPGFQMSFAATVALIVAFEHWSRVAPHIPRVIRPVAMLVLTSVVAGLATAPVTAAHFHRVSEYGLLANLLAVPLMGTVVMPAGVLAGLLAPLGLSGAALWVMGKGIAWMLWVAEMVAGLEGAVFAVPAPPWFVLPVLALAAAGAILGGRVLRGGAVAALIFALLKWGYAPRPDLLLAPEGELIALRGAEGLTLSKPVARFVAGRWLEADGDATAPERAAKRAGFSGEKALRRASLNGRTVVHLTGKTAEDHLPETCAGGAIVVMNRYAPRGDWSGCDLWDKRRLDKTGASALMPDGRWLTATESAGARPWGRQ